MIVDCHTHIFPDYIKNSREEYFHNEQAFKLLYSSPAAKISGVDELMESMDSHGVSTSMVFGFPWKSGETARRNNDYIMDAVSRFPDRLKGFACFDMEWQDAPMEVERCIRGGLCGVGELAFYLSGIDGDALLRLEPVMDICLKAGNLPVMIHTNESVGHTYPGKTPNTVEQIYELARTFPDNLILLAHWGGGIFFYYLLKKDAKDVLKNIWYDTAASPFLYDPAIYRVVREVGLIDKVLFGSDYPLLGPGRYFKDMNESGISIEDKRKIQGENAQLLFSL
ncbi:MAG: amidohydrolase family protein [Desulfamplus sp.]|nr:amidohydrolase family protein [Desulfamplus sp.]